MRKVDGGLPLRQFYLPYTVLIDLLEVSIHLIIFFVPLFVPLEFLLDLVESAY
jgi:hypothetical protein